MTDAAASGPPRLEVRWIRRGALHPRLLEWFGRYPISTESRVDNYLSNPDIDGLSVKIRGGRTLEVKVHRGRRGEIVVPGRARGVLESWQRWSFPSGTASWFDIESPGWISVSKVRRVTFVHGNGDQSPGGTDPGREIGCAVELTDVATGGQQWWTMSLEANGPASELRGLLDRTAEMVFSEPMPGGTEFRSNESTSYSGGLRQV